MYTKTFAQHFLNQAKGKGFSADLDQFIIAYLTQATVIPIPLENAMPRSMYTK
ncbi:MAG: hypothetical protein LBO09_09530 [Candidatus Peribacteria bacterium]|jgi:hypothetical protein|nr:hypothetical protein [Candidatus Peribacteria bacterium]